MEITITRYEDLLLADTVFDAEKMNALQQSHPAFTDLFFEHIYPGEENLVRADDPELKLDEIETWIQHPRTRWLYDTVKQIYPDVSFLEKELTRAFQFARHYFPEKEVPRIYTTISDFGYFPFIYAEDSLRDGIGISLEMFLGEDFPYRDYNGIRNVFSDYLIRSYNKEHITRRTMDVWLDDLAGPAPGPRLLDHMIHNGKRLYILDHLLPEVHDSVIMDYPAEKLDWVRANERDIWVYFTTSDLLYETSMARIQKFIGPSPGSPGMPPEAPGNTGSWLGWKIVQAYMANHPNTTFQQLLNLANAQAFLDQSGYKPPR